MEQLCDKLRQFIVPAVTETGTVLGCGAYGVVVELKMAGTVCAGKKLHNFLADFQNEGVKVMVEKYYRECSLLSELRHPNIVQFLGICFLPGSKIPLLMMEKLDTNLDALLENKPNISLAWRVSVLHDVCQGLVFLHSRNPIIVHRDLTARNVLLDSSMKAKIADLGNSRITDLRQGQLAQAMTKGIPGTLVYMPPEAISRYYGPPLDIFSFGHLTLFTVLQVFPKDLLPAKYPGRWWGYYTRTELERRAKYIMKLEEKFEGNHAMVNLIRGCLSNEPDKRPTANKLLISLAVMEAGYRPFKDMTRLQLEDTLAQHAVAIDTQVDEITACRSKLQQLDRECREKKAENEELSRNLSQQQMAATRKDGELSSLKNRCNSLQSKLLVSQGKNYVLEKRQKTKSDILALREAEVSTLKKALELERSLQTKSSRSRNGSVCSLGKMITLFIIVLSILLVMMMWFF